ncbi:MAG TPA: flagellar type III secretion system pore protein FliP [Acidobacteriaceae bacterium]
MRFVNRSSAGGCLALAALLIAIVPGSVKGQGIQQRGTPAEVRASRSPSSVLKPAQGSNAALPRRKAAAITRKSSQAAITPAVPVTELDSIARQLDGSQSVPWSIVIGLTLLTLLPALLLSMTPLVRLLVVFHFLRQALGTQTAPSNQVLMGLGLMMTWFLMQPVLLQVDQTALAPYRAGTISGEQALQLGAAPVKAYMLRYAREKDLTLFASAGIAARPKMAQDLPMQVVVPAYMLSELKAGFQIGAVLFLPFLLVDLAIASITTSIGMMQLPPVVISTPVKILLFVMVDGWNLLAGSLLKSF